MIEVRAIEKSFGTQKVLSDVSVSLSPGKVSMLIGKSGGGKTVLLKILLGLLAPDEGAVLYDGRSFFVLSETQKKEIRKQIGMVFQNSALFDSLSVQENLLFPLDALTKTPRREKIDRVAEVLERVNLPGIQKKFPNELSGGMQKRVAIARALILRPRYFFCDEPNSGLDPKTSVLIDSLIQELTRDDNMTTLVVSHDMNSVLEIGDHVFFLEHGRCDWNGTRGDMLHTQHKPLHDYVFASHLMQGAKKMLAREIG